LKWKESNFLEESEINTKKEGQAQTNGIDVTEQDFFAQFGVH
jgi:hypothetical protein